jgi:hypothetical protein
MRGALAQNRALILFFPAVFLPLRARQACLRQQLAVDRFAPVMDAG